MTLAGLRAAFDRQASSCADLGSGFMAQLCALLAERLAPGHAIADRLIAWPGDLSSGGASVPLRLAGALHALRLSGHAGLSAVYPPAVVDDDTLWNGIDPVLRDEVAFIDGFLDSAPQTNEVRRAAVLIALGHWLAARHGRGLRLSELGASAGLNLMWDSFVLRIGEAAFGPADSSVALFPDWRGDLPPQAAVTVAARRGVDLNPLSPDPLSSGADALRLQAYLWPDQPERLALTRAAVALARAPVDRGDAADWLPGRLAHVPGQLHLVYTTIAWQYFPPDRQARARDLIVAAGRAATARHPLAWFAMEADGAGPGAALTLRLWPGDLTLAMGRADFHGRWVDWRAPAPDIGFSHTKETA